MAGGKELSTDDPEVKKAADFAVGQLAGQSNSLVPPKLEEVRVTWTLQKQRHLAPPVCWDHARCVRWLWVRHQQHAAIWHRTHQLQPGSLLQCNVALIGACLTL